MSKYKYPAYKMLLQCLHVPTSCLSAMDDEKILGTCLVLTNRAKFIESSLSLLFQSCLVSPLNAEEVVAEGGVFVLDTLLEFYIRTVCILLKEEHVGTSGVRSHSIACPADILVIIRLLVRTLAGIAFYESGRKALASLHDPTRLCLNWRRCVEGSFHGTKPSLDETVSITRFALEGICSMAKSEKMQEHLIGCGVVWQLVSLLLRYDPTLDQALIGSEDQDDLHLSQAACNTHARLSARALGMLSGLLKDPSLASPKNEDLFKALEKVLTPSIAKLLRNKRTGDLLQTLNSNIETPVRIWNVNMRKELTNFLAKQRKSRPDDASLSISEELSITTGFCYDALKNEVQIGGVYLR
jgi:hypothetical protein